MESNDSPEIPDRGETSDIPSLPSGAQETTFYSAVFSAKGTLISARPEPHCRQSEQKIFKKKKKKLNKLEHRNNVM